jgi:hypothetical protein
MHDRDILTEEQWARIEPLLPPVKGAMGRPCVPHRPVVEGIVYRYRAGLEGAENLVRRCDLLVRRAERSGMIAGS